MTLRDLTVVLTLKDRAQFTYRWMAWMEARRFPHKILIADGGSDPALEARLSDRRHYPSLDYDYIRYPYDADVGTFLRKVADVAGRIQTPFVLSADNDDLILPEALEENLRVMRERPDVHSLSPAQYRFKIQRPACDVAQLVSAEGADVSVARLKHVEIPEFEDVDPVKRMLACVERFHSAYIWYGVHRTEDYRRINVTVERLGFTRLMFHEWFSIYAYSLAGKIVLDATPPFLMRQMETSQAATSTYSAENHANIFLLSDWSQQLYAMMGGLHAAILEQGGRLEREAFESSFREAFRKHMLSFMEFRGLANRFKRFQRMYAFGKAVFQLYRGKNPVLSRSEVRANESLASAIRFLSNLQPVRPDPKFGTSDIRNVKQPITR